MSQTTMVVTRSHTAAGTSGPCAGTLPGNPHGTPAARLGTAVRPLRRPLPLLLVCALIGAASGCLQRSLPLPPPSITAQGVTVCPPDECPQGGLIVTLEGLALPGAQVVVDDTAAHASATTGEALTVVTEATAAGLWRAVLGPVRVRGSATVLAPRVGDALSVFQISAPPANEVSSPLTVVVTAPR